MVLSPSDYSVPEPGENMDPSDPTGFASRLAGMTVVLTAVVFAYRVATKRAAPAADEMLGKVTGGLVSYSGSSGNDPWGGL